jgi:purine-nucleoside phosphorylase
MEHMIAYVQRLWPHQPRMVLILGSGLGDIAARMLTDPVVIPYAHIPSFPQTTVLGHAGEWVCGHWHGVPVVLLRGRVHMYEGYAPDTVTVPLRLARALGAQTLIQTNAAGAINTSFAVGDLMLITDHINAMGRNPLVGNNDDALGPRFPDMSNAYSKQLRVMAQQAAAHCACPLRQGVYVGVLGPSFETPAEIRMLRAWGADAVGMSTVPETIAAVHAGMDVLGISCVSNMAAGILDQPLTHEEVMEAGEAVKPKFSRLLDAIVRIIGEQRHHG